MNKDVSILERQRRERGFSLVELMVSLSIFSIVMTLSVGTLLVLIDANAKAQALSSAMTNITFALDSMTRNIRTGSNFHCTSASASTLTTGSLPNSDSIQDCAGGNTALVFTPGQDLTTRIAYRFNSTAGSIEQRIDRGAAGSWVPITSTQLPVGVTISTVRFVVEGVQDTTSNDAGQPRASFLVRGYAQNGLSVPTPFEIQSRVTQRILDY